MVWKQDLAKLKHQLKEEGDPPPPPAPKPTPPAFPPRSFGEEDATFLAAMGKPVPPKLNPAEQAILPISNMPLSAPTQPETEIEFKDALGSLQGLRPLGRNPVLSAPLQAPREVPVEEAAKTTLSLPEKAVELARVDSPPGLLSITQPPPPKGPPGPRLIHLAAGMAVEVEAVLDLRGHSVHDAKERLKERLQDAGVLGWRTLHVILGPSEALRQAFLAFLMTQPAKILAQYAQAPIPMGGNQAFIVYFVGPSA